VGLDMEASSGSAMVAVCSTLARKKKEEVL
jgi:hypothetical protein